MIRLGYQIPNFTYPGVGPEGLFDVIAAQAVAAEQSGFDTVLVMDHFYQLPMLGPPENEMLECYAVLSVLATQTEKVKLSALVTGNTYRNPALTAKIVTALDVISKGRAICAMGTGWFEHEHESLGFEFETFTQRFEKLEEALQIIKPMLHGEPVTFEGKHYKVTDAINSPPPVQANGVPILIGGSGEKKTLRMVAEYADESNMTCGMHEIAHKLDVLEGHLSDHDRNRSDVNVTWLRTVVIAPTHDEAIAEGQAFLSDRGIHLEPDNPDSMEFISAFATIGDPDEVAEQLSGALGAGLDGLTINLPANGHNTERVALAGETLSKLF